MGYFTDRHFSFLSAEDASSPRKDRLVCVELNDNTRRYFGETKHGALCLKEGQSQQASPSLRIGRRKQ